MNINLKSKYDQILESTQRIKNLIKNKYKTRKPDLESSSHTSHTSNTSHK